MPSRGKEREAMTVSCTLAIVMRGLHQNTVSPQLTSSIDTATLSETTYNESKFYCRLIDVNKN